MIWKVSILAALIVVVALALEPLNLFRGFGAEDHRCKEDRCTVHEEELQKDTVKVGYGMIWENTELREAKEKEFPFAYSSIYGGGCFRPPDGPRYAKVKYCPECRVKEQEYWDRRKLGATPN